MRGDHTMGERKPQGGDAVRLAAPWHWAGDMVKVGAIGVLDGTVGKDLDGGSITFNTRPFRGRGQYPYKLDQFRCEQCGALITADGTLIIAWPTACPEDVPHKPLTPVEYVSCSGGPATIYTPATGLTATDETVTLRVWRWNNQGPGAGHGIDYTVTVPVWDWTPTDKPRERR